ESGESPPRRPPPPSAAAIDETAARSSPGARHPHPAPEPPPVPGEVPQSDPDPSGSTSAILSPCSSPAMLAELQPKEDISISLQADISISMLHSATPPGLSRH